MGGALLREPLVHFALLGALVLGVDVARGGGESGDAHAGLAEPERDLDIVVDDARLVALTDALAATLGRAPTDAERDEHVRAWLSEEMLVREAIARGLEREDPVVRAHLAREMSWVLDAREAPPIPSDDALRALLADHPERYAVAGRMTLRQRFYGADEAAARADIPALNAADGDVRALPDAPEPPPGGPVLRGRTPERLAETHGDAFAATASAAPLETWLVSSSRFGWHAVRVESRVEGRALTFDEARARLEADWTRAWMAQARARAVEALAARYRVQGWPR